MTEAERVSKLQYHKAQAAYHLEQASRLERVTTGTAAAGIAEEQAPAAETEDASKQPKSRRSIREARSFREVAPEKIPAAPVLPPGPPMRPPPF